MLHDYLRTGLVQLNETLEIIAFLTKLSAGGVFFD
jgi:hypothetical protein